VCKLFWKELSFAMKLEVFFSPFSEFLKALLSSLLLLLSSFFPSLSISLSLCLCSSGIRVRQESTQQQRGGGGDRNMKASAAKIQ